MPQVERRTCLALGPVWVGAGGDGAGDAESLRIVSRRTPRSLCGDCGTPLSFKDERLPGEVYVMVGVFNDLESFKPEAHDWVSQKTEWLDIRDDLPRYQKSSKLG